MAVSLSFNAVATIRLAALLLLLLPGTACSASFDCAKASTKVEKMICADSKLGKLDEELAKLYQGALDKATEEQKKLLLTEQRHWLKHTRNICEDETCLKLAYWSRQAGLETFYEPKSTIYEHESNKNRAIKELLTSTNMQLDGGTQDVPFCTQLFDDLKQMKGITFIDPVVQVQSYEASALDKWKKYCGPDLPPLHFSYGCEPRVSKSIHSYRDTIETSACSKGFGVGPFKLFELPSEKPGGKDRTIFYSDDNFGSNVWEYDKIYTDKLWRLKKPQLGRGGVAGFRQIDPDKCSVTKNGVGADAAFGSRNGKNYNSILKYKDKYYFLVLNRRIYAGSDGNAYSWWLNSYPISRDSLEKKRNCFWQTPLEPYRTDKEE